jgi:hypothetical protein
MKEDLLWAVQASASSTTNYALGFKLYADGRIGHSGSQSSARTIFKIDPESNQCFIVMTSSHWAVPGDILDVLVESYHSLAEGGSDDSSD